MKHLDYIKHKSEITRMKFQLQMMGKLLSKSEKLLPIKSDPDTNQPPKQTKSKDTVGVDIPLKDKSKGVKQ